MKKLFCFSMAAAFSLPVFLSAQDTSSVNRNTEVYDMSLEDLMNIKVSVASVKELTALESPGIITVITEEEILASGARDLMDILKTIPGFDFGVDVEGVVGAGIRGNWAHEGKMLLLIDGQEMNEGLFGTIQLGNHYPIEQIKRIEIIRGPGSAVYGRNAEYAVINIITKCAKDFSGLTLTSSYGLMDKTFARRNTSLYIGKAVNDFSANVFAYYGEANRSNQVYRDVYGNEYDMTNQSALTNSFVNVGLKYKKLQFRSIIDRYVVETQDNYAAISQQPFNINFNSVFAELKNEIAFSDKFSITPKINFKSQVPYQFKGPQVEDDFEVFNIRYNKYNVEVASSYDPATFINIISGINYFYNDAKELTPGYYFSNDDDAFMHNSWGMYAQVLLKNKIANITVGTRYSLSNLFNASFVPRIGITKVIDKMHFKLLYSKAYRSPSIMNIDPNPTIEPENTSVIELETGYRLTDDMMITLNGYDVETKDPIVFYYDPLTNQDEYGNFYKTGTRGFEGDLKIKKSWGSVDVNYSFYSAKNISHLSNYQVPANDNSLLGFTNQKANALAVVKLNESISLSPSLSFYGERYGISTLDANGNSVYTRYDPLLMGNFFINYKNAFIKGLHIGLGVYNITDARYAYIQPYYNQHAPLPGESRELTLKISYNTNF